MIKDNLYKIFDHNLKNKNYMFYLIIILIDLILLFFYSDFLLVKLLSFYFACKVYKFIFLIFYYNFLINFKFFFDDRFRSNVKTKIILINYRFYKKFGSKFYINYFNLFIQFGLILILFFSFWAFMVLYFLYNSYNFYIFVMQYHYDSLLGEKLYGFSIKVLPKGISKIKMYKKFLFKSNFLYLFFFVRLPDVKSDNDYIYLDDD